MNTTSQLNQPPTTRKRDDHKIATTTYVNELNDSIAKMFQSPPSGGAMNHSPAGVPMRAVVRKAGPNGESDLANGWHWVQPVIFGSNASTNFDASMLSQAIHAGLSPNTLGPSSEVNCGWAGPTGSARIVPACLLHHSYFETADDGTAAPTRIRPGSIVTVWKMNVVVGGSGPLPEVYVIFPDIGMAGCVPFIVDSNSFGEYTGRAGIWGAVPGGEGWPDVEVVNVSDIVQATFNDETVCTLINSGEFCRTQSIIAEGTVVPAWPMNPGMGGGTLYIALYNRGLRDVRISPDGTTLQKTYDNCDPPGSGNWSDWATIAQCTGSSLADFEAY